MTTQSEERQRLASMLRALRLDAALSTTELARRLNWSQSKVSKTERGETSPPPEDVQEWARLTKASEQTHAELAELAEITNSEAVEMKRYRAPGRRRRQEELHRLEANASAVRAYSGDLVIGLAQTRPYARAMFMLGGRQSPEERLDEVVDARLARQESLNNLDRQFEFVMNESAFRRKLIPAEDMRQQVQHLIEFSHRPNVDFGLITFNSNERVHQLHSFSMIGDPGRDAESIVLIQTLTRRLVIRDPEEIAEYLEHFNALRTAAISGDELRAFLREVIEDLGR
ncbi:helix-turn-helix domain-containing protein [Lentzea tibetensis]|nr:helix-turn-helix transcriptional regulator [Lentzea tibetensis]